MCTDCVLASDANDDCGKGGYYVNGIGGMKKSQLRKGDMQHRRARADEGGARKLKMGAWVMQGSPTHVKPVFRENTVYCIAFQLGDEGVRVDTAVCMHSRRYQRRSKVVVGNWGWKGRLGM